MSDEFSPAYRLLTPPAAEPVTLAQAKAFLRIDYTQEDALIELAITAARQAAEHYLRLVLVPQEWELTQPLGDDRKLRLWIGPLRELGNIQILDEAGTGTDLSSEQYQISTDGYQVCLRDRRAGMVALRLRYTAGLYAAAEQIPALLVQGMLHHVAVMMDQRDGSVALPAHSIQAYASSRRVGL